ncbi:hypothetical protein SCAZ3_10785 [Streptococcus canis FSL Z3-227]|uniref:Uncharacterized protein n=1 Tax=Streptococcus canis FSL Z3-227 TaxID=482234 RepID=A0AAV3FUM8_STRCB|nr:hypothetical protein SCAZ3_10785 [Streptococcus canis FSL Z3-227]
MIFPFIIKKPLLAFAMFSIIFIIIEERLAVNERPFFSAISGILIGNF